MICGRVAFSTLLLLLLLVLALFASVQGLKCYQCESHTQLGCFPLDTSLVPLTECPAGTQSCTMIRQNAIFKLTMGKEHEPAVRVIRGCSPEPSAADNICVDRAGTCSSTKSRYCSCNSDACNPAGRNVAVNSGILVAIIFAVYNLVY